jgi:acetyl/propionyl-CoA carboxylase alpha subunit
MRLRGLSRLLPAISVPRYFGAQRHVLSVEKSLFLAPALPRVTEVHVESGQTVTQGDPLVALANSEVEVLLRAPVTGTVTLDVQQVGDLL